MLSITVFMGLWMFASSGLFPLGAAFESRSAAHKDGQMLAAFPKTYVSFFRNQHNHSVLPTDRDSNSVHQRSGTQVRHRRYEPQHSNASACSPYPRDRVDCTGNTSDKMCHMEQILREKISEPYRSVVQFFDGLMQPIAMAPVPSQSDSAKGRSAPVNEFLTGTKLLHARFSNLSTAAQDVRSEVYRMRESALQEKDSASDDMAKAGSDLARWTDEEQALRNQSEDATKEVRHAEGSKAAASQAADQAREEQDRLSCTGSDVGDLILLGPCLINHLVQAPERQEIVDAATDRETEASSNLQTKNKKLGEVMLQKNRAVSSVGSAREKIAALNSTIHHLDLQLCRAANIGVQASALAVHVSKLFRDSTSLQDVVNNLNDLTLLLEPLVALAEEIQYFSESNSSLTSLLASIRQSVQQLTEKLPRYPLSW